MQSVEMGVGNNLIKLAATGCGDNYLTIDYRVLTAGRDFNTNDLEQQTKTCIINERLSRQLFKGKNPIGQFVTISS